LGDLFRNPEGNISVFSPCAA